MSINQLKPTDGSFRLVDSTSGATILDVDSDSKIRVTKIGSLARTDTSAKNLFVLPIGAIPESVSVYSGTAASNPSTATISVGKTSSNTFFVNALDVKGASGQIPCAAATNLMAAVSATATTQVVGIYAETGTATTTGGPFLVKMTYYMP